MELEAVEADAAIDISKFCQGLRCVGKHQRPLRCQGSLDADDRLSSSTGVNVGGTMPHLVHLVVVGMRMGGALAAAMKGEGGALASMVANNKSRLGMLRLEVLPSVSSECASSLRRRRCHGGRVWADGYNGAQPSLVDLAVTVAFIELQ